MSKESISVKSNGLRNELKEIRKSIDKLTNAIEAQTHNRYEKSTTYHPIDSSIAAEGMHWVKDITARTTEVDVSEAD